MNKLIQKTTFIIITIAHLVLISSCDAILFFKNYKDKSEVFHFETNGIQYELNKIKNSDGVSVIANSQNSYNGTINIPETVIFNNHSYPVTVIGEQAFENCRLLDTVKISKNIKIIGTNAFANSTIKDINLDGVQIIGEKAFSNCNNITNLNISNIQIIGDEAFLQCDSLTNVNISNIQIIGKKTFKECKKLKKATLKNIQIIGKEAFGNCYSLDTIIEDNIQISHKTAYKNCSKR